MIILSLYMIMDCCPDNNQATIYKNAIPQSISKFGGFAIFLGIILVSIFFSSRGDTLGLILFSTILLIVLIGWYASSYDYPTFIGISGKGIILEYKKKNEVIEWIFVESIETKREILGFTTLIINKTNGEQVLLSAVTSEIQSAIHKAYNRHKLSRKKC